MGVASSLGIAVGILVMVAALDVDVWDDWPVRVLTSIVSVVLEPPSEFGWKPADAPNDAGVETEKVGVGIGSVLMSVKVGVGCGVFVDGSVTELVLVSGKKVADVVVTVVGEEVVTVVGLVADGGVIALKMELVSVLLAVKV